MAGGGSLVKFRPVLPQINRRTPTLSVLCARGYACACGFLFRGAAPHRHAPLPYHTEHVQRDKRCPEQDATRSKWPIFFSRKQHTRLFSFEGCHQQNKTPRMVQVMANEIYPFPIAVQIPPLTKRKMTSEKSLGWLYYQASNFNQWNGFFKRGWYHHYSLSYFIGIRTKCLFYDCLTIVSVIECWLQMTKQFDIFQINRMPFCCGAVN